MDNFYYSRLPRDEHEVNAVINFSAQKPERRTRKREKNNAYPVRREEKYHDKIKDSENPDQNSVNDEYNLLKF